jgi:hypothetical protein
LIDGEGIENDQDEGLPHDKQGKKEHSDRMTLTSPYPLAFASSDALP